MAHAAAYRSYYINRPNYTRLLGSLGPRYPQVNRLLVPAKVSLATMLQSVGGQHCTTTPQNVNLATSWPSWPSTMRPSLEPLAILWPPRLEFLACPLTIPSLHDCRVTFSRTKIICIEPDKYRLYFPLNISTKCYEYGRKHSYELGSCFPGLRCSGL